MTDTRRPSLSIVIPAYNEAGRLGVSLGQVRDYAAASRKAIEVIVVDDGSTDATAELVERFDPGTLSVRLLSNAVNMGKGHSVRRGVLDASGQAVLMTDADLSTPITEVDKLLGWLDDGFAVVIGSRRMPETVLGATRAWYRHMMQGAFQFLRRRMILRDIRDTQCGFKCFRRDAAMAIFAQQRTDGWAFDCEVLALARRLGYRVKEVGVVWCEDPDSRLRPVRDSVGMLISLVRIRRRMRRFTPPA